jgi:site-specific recombinase XerD
MKLPRQVTEILGHNQLSTTKRYSHLQNERLVEAANIAGQVVWMAGE